MRWEGREGGERGRGVSLILVMTTRTKKNNNPRLQFSELFLILISCLQITIFECRRNWGSQHTVTYVVWLPRSCYNLCAWAQIQLYQVCCHPFVVEGCFLRLHYCIDCCRWHCFVHFDSDKMNPTPTHFNSHISLLYLLLCWRRRKAKTVAVAEWGFMTGLCDLL